MILKLHGSLDWLAARDRPRHRNNRARYGDSDYCSLDERLGGTRPYTKQVPSGDRDLIRVRAFENLGRAWMQVKSRADRLHMVTMGTGKGSRLGELEPVWEAAYHALSRAKSLTVVGYSMPPDDIEIRTLLRAGIMRGGGPGPTVTVRNPSPDVHHRLRSILDREIISDYRSVPSV